MELNCLSCGAALPLQSPATIFVVCRYCQSTLIRDQDWSVFGRMAELPPEITPLQLGTQGQYRGDRFELIGRLRLKWAQGFWNEWCALFPRGRIGWLAEAQGFYMLSFPLIPRPELPPLNELRVGQEIDLGRTGNFVVDDIKSAVCVATEGELPFPAPAPLELLSIDASNAKGDFLCLERLGSTVQAHVGRYLDFQDFQFTQLRPLDGW